MRLLSLLIVGRERMTFLSKLWCNISRYVDVLRDDFVPLLAYGLSSKKDAIKEKRIDGSKKLGTP